MVNHSMKNSSGEGEIMSMRQMMSAFTIAVSGAKVCWMRDGDGKKVSVLAILPESTRLAAEQGRSRRLAARAEKLAATEASRIGIIMSKGVYMGGDGNGSVTATGVAELSWSPEVEQRLVLSGIPQLQ